MHRHDNQATLVCGFNPGRRLKSKDDKPRCGRCRSDGRCAFPVELRARGGRARTRLAAGLQQKRPATGRGGMGSGMVYHFRDTSARGGEGACERPEDAEARTAPPGHESAQDARAAQEADRPRDGEKPEELRLEPGALYTHMQKKARPSMAAGPDGGFADVEIDFNQYADAGLELEGAEVESLFVSHDELEPGEEIDVAEAGLDVRAAVEPPEIDPSFGDAERIGLVAGEAPGVDLQGLFPEDPFRDFLRPFHPLERLALEQDDGYDTFHGRDLFSGIPFGEV